MRDVIKKYRFKADAPLQIEVVPLAGLTIKSSQYLLVPHRTDFYHIFLFDDCAPAHLVDFELIRLQPYSLLCIDSDRIHQFDESLHYTGNVLIFKADFFGMSATDAAFLRKTILFNDITDKPGFQPATPILARLN